MDRSRQSEEELKAIRLLLLENLKGPIALEGWISKKQLMRFFDYGDTQWKTFVQRENLQEVKIGNRRFYKLTSIGRLFEEKIS